MMRAACVALLLAAADTHAASPREELRQALRARLPASGAIHATFVPAEGLGHVSISWRSPGPGFSFITQDTATGVDASGRAFAGPSMFAPGVQYAPPDRPAPTTALDPYTPLGFFADFIAGPDLFDVERRPDGGWTVTRRCPQAVRSMRAQDVDPAYAASFPEGEWRMELDPAGKPTELVRTVPGWDPPSTREVFTWSTRVPEPWLINDAPQNGAYKLASFELDPAGAPERFTKEAVTMLAVEANRQHQAAMTALTVKARRQAGLLPADPARPADERPDPAWTNASRAAIVVGGAMIVVGVAAWIRRRGSA